jgi:hypothetical protein
LSVWSREHRIELCGTRQEILEALDDAAEAWGAEWQPEGSGGALTIPVSAGLRLGHLKGEVSIREVAEAWQLSFTVEHSHYRLHMQAFVVLLLGALGGLSLVVAPFYPPLFGLAPVGIVLSLAAWFLVASKLRTRGPQDFLRLLEELRQQPEKA